MIILENCDQVTKSVMLRDDCQLPQRSGGIRYATELSAAVCAFVGLDPCGSRVMGYSMFMCGVMRNNTY